MRATLRPGITATTLEKTLNAPNIPAVDGHANDPKLAGTKTEKKGASMTILYGSNTGTCETFARRLAMNLAGRGVVPIVQDMDSASGRLSKAQPIVIVTASYEGQPPDNASHFTDWLEKLQGQALEGIKYAVFGCGHSMDYIIPRAVIV